ncbi:MAG: DUF1178 family protein [Pseudomonadota bacterium]|jgi:hypothetical protein
MIVLNLVCEQQHKFEGWFHSNEDFARQNERGLVSCPACGSTAVARLPSGPRVVRARAKAEPAPNKQGVPALFKLLQAVLESTEDVGERFAEEARKIHYEEVPARNIRGVTSVQDAKELLEEGIAVLPLPLPPRSGMH